MLSDLPTELAAEVLSRVPMKYMRAVRSVCKKWNTLSKNRTVLRKHLAKAAAAREFTVVVVAGFRASLMSVNLHGIYEGVVPSINRQGKLVSLSDSDCVDICQAHHCDGLLLCTIMNNTRLVVWNPYLGQTRWFETNKNAHDFKGDGPVFSIGYENCKSYRSYKILRFAQVSKHCVWYELHYINSESCTDITMPITIDTDWVVGGFASGASVKGNTYWYAQEKVEDEVANIPVFLICFDFTTERFGPRLSLPFQSYRGDTVTLSSVRDAQLAVLFQNHITCETEIWITTKIEPKVASWSKVFLKVDMNLSTPVRFLERAGSFFVDEEKKVAVVFTDTPGTRKYFRKVAFIIGEDGYFKKVDFGEVFNMYCCYSCPVMCSYVSSLVEIIPPARGV